MSAFGNIAPFHFLQDLATVLRLMGAFGVFAFAQIFGKFGKAQCQILLFHKEKTIKIQQRKAGVSAT